MKKQLTTKWKKNAFIVFYTLCLANEDAKRKVIKHSFIEGEEKFIKLDDFLYFLQKQITEEMYRIEKVMIPRCDNLNLKNEKEKAEMIFDRLETYQIQKISDFNMRDFLSSDSKLWCMKSNFIDDFVKEFVN